MPPMKQTTIRAAFRRKEDQEAEKENERKVEELQALLETAKSAYDDARKELLARRKPKQSVKRLKIPKTEESILENDIVDLSEKLWMAEIGRGIVVHRYIENDEANILFKIQCLNSLIEHGMIIDLSGKNKTPIYSMPQDFPIEKILSDFKDPREDVCALTIYRALLAFYNRKEQCFDLDKIVPVGVVVSMRNAEKIDIILRVISMDNPEEASLKICLRLVYGINHTRPKAIKILSTESTDLKTEQKKTLWEQCQVFLDEPLDVAFEAAFLTETEGYYQSYHYAQNSSINEMEENGDDDDDLIMSDESNTSI